MSDKINGASYDAPLKREKLSVFGLIFGKFEVLVLFFGHKFPIAHGHIALHLSSVFARGNINGVIVFFPKSQKSFFAFRKDDFRFRDGRNQPFAAVVDACNFSFHVVDDEGGGLESCDEMGHE